MEEEYTGNQAGMGRIKEIWHQVWFRDTMFQISSEGNIRDENDNPVQPVDGAQGYCYIPGYSMRGNLSRLVPQLFLNSKQHCDMHYIHKDGNYRNFRVDNFIRIGTGRKKNETLVMKDKIRHYVE